MALIGFARVSTTKQDLTFQIEALQAAGCSEIFSGKQSGVSDDNEKKLAEMIKYIRKDDVVIVTKLTRLGRSLKSILSAIESIHAKKATLKTLDDVIDTSNDSPFAKATVNLIAVLAQLDRDLIISRTAEGRELAKSRGKHLGRRKTISEDDRKKIRSSKKSVMALARQYKVSHTTINRIKKEVSS